MCTRILRETHEACKGATSARLGSWVTQMVRRGLRESQGHYWIESSGQRGRAAVCAALDLHGSPSQTVGADCVASVRCGRGFQGRRSSCCFPAGAVREVACNQGRCPLVSPEPAPWPCRPCRLCPVTSPAKCPLALSSCASTRALSGGESESETAAATCPGDEPWWHSGRACLKTVTAHGRSQAELHRGPERAWGRGSAFPT